MIEPKRPDSLTDKREPQGKPEDERAPMAQAMGIAYEMMSISLEMALVPLGGYWVDTKLGTSPLFLILGGLLGFSLAFYHLMRFTSAMEKKK